MLDKPIKCVSGEFKANPFYFIETDGSNKRFVASFQDLEKIRQFIYSFVDTIDSDVEVKIRDFEEREHPAEFTGTVSKYKLLKLIDKYSEIVFHDGFHDLMIRRPESDEYIAFDQHGLIYIYSKENYSLTLVECGLAFKPGQKLISEFGHMHFRPADANDKLKNLISDLGLQ